MKWLVYQCWTYRCKTLGEAINNPRLIRTTEFDDKKNAEKYLKQCKGKQEANFVYWLKQSL